MTTFSDWPVTSVPLVWDARDIKFTDLKIGMLVFFRD